ncbi:T6SS immunity protein Tli4 family protein, partial [Pseudomonas protegens]|uniref:T6SS immunity protein Tli4 family protein n=1 Tax=Pseudomonas protegens TaxID=380021 RepID=UPI001187384E
MKRARCLVTILGLIALSSVISCTSIFSSRNPAMDRTGWITHCYGRFQIDLPPQAEIKTGYDLWGSSIKALDDTVTTLATRIDQREKELKGQQHDTKGSMFLRRFDLGGGSTGLLSWASDASVETYYLSTYVLSKTTWQPYSWRVEMSPDREHRGIEIATSLARNLHSRAPNEIPTEPGFCIDRAYIAGDSFQSEGFGIGVTFPEHPRTFLAFRSSTGAERDRLLDRVSGFLMGVAKMVAGIETLRKRERGGAIPADEYLLAGSAKG